MPEAETWRYRGQTIDREQIAFLREFIRAHPHSSRWKLSRQLCEALGWKQANGALRDVVCRGLLLMLERGGEIELPPVRRRIRLTLFLRQAGAPLDNKCLRAGIEEIHPTPQELSVLQDSKWRLDRRLIHESDSHLRVKRC